MKKAFWTKAAVFLLALSLTLGWGIGTVNLVLAQKDALIYRHVTLAEAAETPASFAGEYLGLTGEKEEIGQTAGLLFEDQKVREAYDGTEGKVTVCGRAAVSRGKLTLTVQWAGPAGNVPAGSFGMAGSRGVRPESWTLQRIGETVRYRVPEDWIAVEEGIGEKEGSLYTLNRLSGKAAPELLYVFWLERKAYLFNLDAPEVMVENSIIKGVLGKKAALHPTRMVFDEKTYRTAFDQYATSFEDKNGDRHQVEFAFTPVGEGILTLVYVYDKPEHRDEILYLMRFLED